MSSIFPLVPKPFNYSPTTITGNASLSPDTYNVVYADISAPATLTMPAIPPCIDGVPVLIVNQGTATLTVNTSTSSLIVSVPANSSVLLILNKLAVVWEVALGPVSGTYGLAVALATSTPSINVFVNASTPPGAGYTLVTTSQTSASWQVVTSGGVNGPVSSTVTALALWGNTIGTQLTNSVVLVDGSGNMTGVGTINYTPGTPSNWLTVPDTLQSGLNNMAFSAGTFLTLGVDPNVTATGSTQGTAYQIVKALTYITTAASNTGVVLPSATAGRYFAFTNDGLNAVNIYPASGQSFKGESTNAAISLSEGGFAAFYALNSTTWGIAYIIQTA
jgi:hypothetical protein